ncbi:MAG: hypothetical protein AABX13_03245 [Nanoarchaeota archaeon]
MDATQRLGGSNENSGRIYDYVRFIDYYTHHYESLAGRYPGRKVILEDLDSRHSRGLGLNSPGLVVNYEEEQGLKIWRASVACNVLGTIELLGKDHRPEDIKFSYGKGILTPEDVAQAQDLYRKRTRYAQKFMGLIERQGIEAVEKEYPQDLQYGLEAHVFYREDIHYFQRRYENRLMDSRSLLAKIETYGIEEVREEDYYGLPFRKLAKDGLITQPMIDRAQAEHLKRMEETKRWLKEHLPKSGGER